NGLRSLVGADYGMVGHDVFFVSYAPGHGQQAKKGKRLCLHGLIPARNSAEKPPRVPWHVA
ncbi:hypothetical protein, partial [Alcanivorax sp. HI0044]|uniref:hypothetical protein n=1 Tax=Alcanivorax sp. HI0044 TaxID=1822234 RepID=UPI001E3743E8